MVTDQELSQAIQCLLRDSASAANPSAFSSLNAVVQELETKLGLDLSHKVDFIHAQIQFLLRSHPLHPQHHHRHHQPPPPQPPPPPQKDLFTLHQTPNFQSAPSPTSSAFHTFTAQPPPPKPDTAVAPTLAPSDPPKERWVLFLFVSFWGFTP